MKNWQWVGLLLPCFLACSGVAPDIDTISWQISLDISAKDYRREVLSLFVLAQDGDGIKDLEEAYLVWLEDGSSWSLPNGSWKLQETKGKYQWLTNTAIEPLENGRFPRGAYRVYLYDRAGLEDAINFNIQLKRTELASIQVLRPQWNSVGLTIKQVTGTEPQLLGYNFGGELLLREPLTVGLQVFDQLRRENSELAKLIISYRLNGLLVRLGPYQIF